MNSPKKQSCPAGQVQRLVRRDRYSSSIQRTWWTLTLTKNGRKAGWQLREGPSLPAETLIDIPLERAIVQSILPAEGSRKYISLMILENGSAQNFSHELNPDPHDYQAFVVSV